MPTPSRTELEETVVKLQLRVATLERYTNELVTAVDGILSSKQKTHPPPSTAPQEDRTASRTLETRFDDLQDVLVKRLQTYVDAKLAASATSDASPSPVRPVITAQAPPSASSSCSPSEPKALEHDLLQCVSRIESLMDEQQQQHDDMEACMTLALRLEKRQERLEQMVPRHSTAPPSAGTSPCAGCRALQARVCELEDMMRRLCTERTQRDLSDESAFLLRAASQAQVTEPVSTGAAEAAASLRADPLPMAGNEKALWTLLSALSGEVSAHSAQLAELQARSSSVSARELSPLSAFLNKPAGAPATSRPRLLSPPMVKSALAPCANGVATAKEIQMDATPQALRSLEARARDMQSSLSALT